MRSAKSFLMFLCAILLCTQQSLADIPRQISYQGLVTDNNGLVNQIGTPVEFRLFDVPNGGVNVWQEGPLGIDIADGILIHYLGSTNPLPDTLFTRFVSIWLEVVVNGETISPRTLMSASPYSFRVSTLDSATGGAITGEVSIQGTSIGNQLSVANSGAGRAGSFQIANPASTAPALLATTNSFLGSAAHFFNDANGAIATMSGGFVDIQDATLTTKIVLNALGFPNGGGRISIRNQAGIERVELNGDWFGGGMARLNHPDGTSGITLDGAIGQLEVFDELTGASIQLATGGTFGGLINIESNGGIQTVDIRASETGTDGAELRLKQASGDEGVIIDAEKDGGRGARIDLFNALGVQTINLRASETGTDGAELRLKQASGIEGVIIDAETVGGVGGGTGGARIELYNSAEVATVILDSDVSGDGRIITEVLEITGGSDLSERFQISATEDNSTPEPGMLVSIDPSQIGWLKISTSAYDRKVAGIISGAGGVKTGMIMGQRGTFADGDYAVALTGRVYCYADASYGKIVAGDLLTTSNTPGHAMRATDVNRSYCAIIGKAMSPLDEGTGLILVLVNLQ